jgi:Protein of unknown function (DUF2525)
MNTIKVNSDSVNREIGSDVETMLQAIHLRTSGEVKSYMDSEHTPHPRYVAYSELAEAFELDIRDYASYEVNR